jgi:MFS family permease
MGFFLGISRLGSLVAVALGGVLTDVIGYRSTFLLFAILSALAAVISGPSGERRSRHAKDAPHVAGSPPPQAAQNPLRFRYRRGRPVGWHREHHRAAPLVTVGD